jgi:hypothetical protein
VKSLAVASTATGAGVPVVWDFLGYHFEAGPLVVTVCSTLMTRLIVSLNTSTRPKLALDIVVTLLSTLVSALWVQSNDLALLPAGLTGISFGALGVGIISAAKSQAAAALRAAAQTFLRSMSGGSPR